jgi:thiol-disulfide isomerase/thioredoxin
MTPPRLALRLVVTAATAVVLGSCTGEGDDGATPQGRSPAIVVADAPSIPDTVDALPPVDVDGFHAILSDARGTPVVVNFWASWCEPCQREMPLLADAAREHADEIQFLGIDILDTPDPARAFLARYEVPYPNLFDVAGEARDAVGSLGQPVTVFYDAAGEVVAKADGELSSDDLEAYLERVRA